MALAQSFEAIRPPVGLAESALEAAWVEIDSDEVDSTSSEWERSPCPSPRRKSDTHNSADGEGCQATTTAPAPATSMEKKRGITSCVLAAKIDCGQSDDETVPKTSCDLKLDYYAAELDSVVELAKDRTYKVVLKTHSASSKPLAMFVGDSEGKALLQVFRGWKWQNQGCRRPLTYDFLTSVVEALGRKVMFVRICASERGVFYARAHFYPAAGAQSDDATIDGVDSRPSDALNVALRSDAKVYVHRQLIQDSL